MRIIIFLFIALILTGAYKSVEIDEAKNVYRNWLTNPGAENGLLDVKTNDTFKVSVSTTVFAEGKASFEWSDPTTATYIHFLTKTNPYFEGEKCLASGLIKTPQNTAYGTFEVSIMEENGGLVTILKDVKYYGIGVKKDWDEWEPFEIPFRCPDTSVGKYGIRFKNMWGGFASTDKIYFDNLYVGLDYRTENEKVNYIESKGFEKGIGHWKEYTNSSAIPTNGTSPTHSFGATIGAAAQIEPTLDKTLTSDLIDCLFTPANPCTEILSGNRDLVFEKSAADAQGQGISHDFQVGIADQNKLLGIWFDVDATDANYADDDLQVFVYDIANQQIITPSSPTDGHKIKKGKYRHRVAFAPYDTSAERYRLIIHVASTNASGYSVRFDNFEVGPGAIMTGFDGIWKSYSEANGDFTVTGTSYISNNAVAIPYKTTNGEWRLKFNFDGNIAGTPSTIDLIVSGITFPNWQQSVSAFIRQDGASDRVLLRALTNVSTNNTITVTSEAGGINNVKVSGDVLLASKPTWADFDPIATIYPSTEDLAYKHYTLTKQSQDSLTDNVFRDIGSGSVTLPAGEYTIFYGAYAYVLWSSAPSLGNFVVRVVDSSGIEIGRNVSSGIPLYDGNDSRAEASLSFTHTFNEETTLNLNGRISMNGGTIGSRNVRDGYIIAIRTDASNVPPIGVELASDTQYGLVKKNKWQKKVLAADIDNTAINGNTPLTILGFNGLTEGKIYKAQLTVECNLGNATQWNIDADIPGNNEEITIGSEGSHTITTIFVADSSGSMNFRLRAENGSSGMTIKGTVGSIENTWATIEELNTHAAETTDFN